MALMRQSFAEVITGAREDLLEALKEIRFVRGWLNAEMDGPINNINNLNKQVAHLYKKLSNESEKIHLESRTTTVDPKWAIMEKELQAQVIKKVMTYLTDDDIIQNLLVQKNLLLHELTTEDKKMRVRYRRRIRNQL